MAACPACDQCKPVWLGRCVPASTWTLGISLLHQSPRSGSKVCRLLSAPRLEYSCRHCSRLSGCRNSATAHWRSPAAYASESSDQDGTAGVTDDCGRSWHQTAAFSDLVAGACEVVAMVSKLTHDLGRRGPLRRRRCAESSMPLFVHCAPSPKQPFLLKSAVC